MEQNMENPGIPMQMIPISTPGFQTYPEFTQFTHYLMPDSNFLQPILTPMAFQTGVDGGFQVTSGFIRLDDLIQAQQMQMPVPVPIMMPPFPGITNIRFHPLAQPAPQFCGNFPMGATIPMQMQILPQYREETKSPSAAVKLGNADDSTSSTSSPPDPRVRSKIKTKRARAQANPRIVCVKDQETQAGPPSLPKIDSATKAPTWRNADYCTFCKSRGESEEFCATHRLKVKTIRITCPMLLGTVCPLCKATGQNAHTRARCPLNFNNVNNNSGHNADNNNNGQEIVYNADADDEGEEY